MLVSFDVKFTWRNQKQRSNGEACRTSPSDMFLVERAQLDVKKNGVIVFYLSCIIKDFKAQIESNK